MAKAQAAGISTYNQTPLLRGVNDDPDILAELFDGLSTNGITPYYLFHCRPTTGNESYMMTIQEGEDVVRRTRSRLGGLARMFRYAASHDVGKIEIVGRTGDTLAFRYHQPRNSEDDGRVMLWPYSEPITWLDEVVERDRSGRSASMSGGTAV